jgi:leucine efflux protein
MHGIDRPGSFVLSALLVIVIPGPATLYIAGTAREAWRRAGVAAAGIVVGDLVLIALSALGFAAVLAARPQLVSAIKLVGALYLAYLGVGLLRSRRGAPALASSPSPPSVRAWRHGVTGLLLTLTNPKPVVFFGAFLPLFVARDAPSPLTSFCTLGALFELINLSYFAAMIVVVRRLRASPGVARFLGGGFDRLCGAGLLACSALVLATAFG